MPGNRMVQKVEDHHPLIVVEAADHLKICFLCIWMAGTIVMLQDSSIKMGFLSPTLQKIL